MTSVERLSDWDTSAAPAGCVLVDLHNTILPYSATRADEAAACCRVVALRTALEPRAHLIVVTNARMPADIRRELTASGQLFVESARKPLAFKVAKASTVRPCVVVGDQIVTDGLLAWNLGVPFVHVAGCSTEEPVWPTFQRRLGRILVGLFFTTGSPCD